MVPRLSIVIPTRNRVEMLGLTLQSHLAQQHTSECEWIVVDNGSTDSTQELLSRIASQMRMRVLCVEKAGKSRCLNAAIQVAQGQIIAFTDDDVRVPANWASDLLRASCVYPTATVFCGPIIPVFPPEAPPWLQKHHFAGAAFARFMPILQEGVWESSDVPLGPNFAVRADRISGMRFRVDLGPSENSSLLHEDTEFLDRLRDRGEKFIYIPTAAVWHLIRSELVDVHLLYERAFNMGRSVIVADRRIVLLPREWADSTAESARFTLGSLVNFYLGQCLQLDCYGLGYDQLFGEIAALNWSGDLDLLSQSARRWIAADPGPLRP
jgi:glycosyltransferase involved in cell wall biosynthesis